MITSEKARVQHSDRDFLDEFIADREQQNPSFPLMVNRALLRREVARALLERRLALGLSQADLAATLETSQSTIARLEKGEGDVRLSTLERLAAALGGRINLEVIFGSELNGQPG